MWETPEEAAARTCTLKSGQTECRKTLQTTFHIRKPEKLR